MAVVATDMNTIPAAPLPSRGNHHLYFRPGIGVETMNSLPIHLSPRSSGGKRGKVKGFSRLSANRLRALLFRVDYGAGVLGVALTLPPWIAAEASDLWALLVRKLPALFDFAIIWRKEVQRNMREHYHLLLQTSDVGAATRLLEMWCRLAVKRLAPSAAEKWPGLPREDLESVALSWMLHVHRSAENLQIIQNATPALQYLCDHTSKHKEYQANTSGRAWGVCNRSALRQAFPESLDLSGLSERDVLRLHAAIRKSTRYWRRTESWPFVRYSRGRRADLPGRHTCFKPHLPSALLRYADFLRESRAGTDADADAPPAHRAAPAPSSDEARAESDASGPEARSALREGAGRRAARARAGTVQSLLPGF